MWYKNTPDVIVWVANRNNPLNDSYGTLIITSDGNLLLRNQARNTIWSLNSSMVANNPAAKLLESGNLVVGDQSKMDNNNNKTSDHDTVYYAWQSFDYPTDTILAGMKIGWNFKTGPWDGLRFSASPNTLANPIFNSTLMSNDEELYYTFQTISNAVATRVKIDHLGSIDLFILHNGSTNWSMMYTVSSPAAPLHRQCETRSSPFLIMVAAFNIEKQLVAVTGQLSEEVETGGHAPTL
nr:G-type lectin S-receptor-like serine/threonine-protein kinase At4g27290 [Ziziphus jujuba var. spinosa]